MKKDIDLYVKKVESYFEKEYSDFSINESIEKLLIIENKPKNYWIKKINKLIELHYSLDQSPSNTAAHIAKIFRPRLKNLIK